MIQEAGNTYAHLFNNYAQIAHNLEPAKTIFKKYAEILAKTDPKRGYRVWAKTIPPISGKLISLPPAAPSLEMGVERGFPDSFEKSSRNLENI